MDGKKHFRDCCKLAQIDCKAYFQLGAQNPKRADRWEYKCDAFQRKDTTKYAVCYFQAGNFYAAWDLSAPKAKGKTVFSIKKEDVPSHLQDRAVFVTKAIEFQNRPREIVLIFSPDGVMDFLEKYCKS